MISFNFDKRRVCQHPIGGRVLWVANDILQVCPMKALGLCSIVREVPLILSAVLAEMADGTYMMALSSSGGGRHLQDCCVCDSGERKLTPASVA